MSDPTSLDNVTKVLDRWSNAPSEFRVIAFMLAIRCAGCGGTTTQHGPEGECRLLVRRDKRHGQTEGTR